MRDAGSVGGYAGTNWSAASMIDMWLAIANQDTSPHWQLLSGWRKSYELTLQHMAQVKNYRENLATVWSPEKSPAAAAYIARLDVLIEHLQQTYDAAVANHQAFSTATAALSTARRDLEKVVNEYLANEGKLQTFAREQAERPKGGLQRGAEPKPPVADGQQAQLEAKARSIMSGLSSEISLARVQITKPALYDPAGRIDGGEADPAGTAYIPPAIPPVVPFTPGSTASGANSSVLRTGQHAAQPTPVTPVSSVRQPGLVLGGVDASIAPPPPQIVTPPVVSGPTPPPPIGPTPFPQVVPPALPSQPPTTVRSVPGLGGPPAEGGVRAMPPGGVIGGPPGSGLGQPVTPRSTSAVNPIGGVINPANQATSRSANVRTGVPNGTMAGMPLSRSSNAIEASGRSRWDPDNPWETREGVPPVVTPPTEQRVDPGPAIGLN